MNPRILSFIAATAISLGIAACAFVNPGWVCDLSGENCVIGIKIEGVFCPYGPPAPTIEECQSPPEGDENELLPFDILYETNYGISMSSNSSNGVMQIFRDGALHEAFSVPFLTLGNVQLATNTSALADQIESATSVQGHDYSYILTPPTVNVETSAAEGQIVTLTGTVRVDAQPIASGSMSYQAGPDGGPPKINDEIGGE